MKLNLDSRRVLGRSIILYVLGSTLLGCAMLMQNSVFGIAYAEPDERPGRPKVVLLRLDKHEVRVGDRLTLRELIPKSTDARLTSYTHSIRRMAYFDRNRREMVYLDEYSVDSDRIEQVLLGVHWSATGTGALKYNVTKGEHEGLKFDAIAGHAGVYLVSVKWVFDRDLEHRVSSNPVILIVAPNQNSEAHSVVAQHADATSALDEQKELEEIYGSLMK